MCIRDSKNYLMLSQFFVLSARGDTIINRDFRSDLIKNTPEIFFRHVKSFKGDAPPIFNIDGINFAYLKRSGLFIVGTTRFNVAPSFILEVLVRMTKCIKDFCGVVTEESIRKNFVLIYEILDEMIDFGTPQLLATESVKHLIANEPITIDGYKPISYRPSFLMKDTISSTAAFRPVSVGDQSKQKNEIFVDLFEKISVLFNSSGFAINSMIEGCIQMKSYLFGNPELRLALNDDLVIGKSATGNLGSIVLDDCNFHECVNFSEFELNRTLKIKPPDGEFTVMNYRITNDFQAPFRIFPYIDEVSSYKLELLLKVRACYPKDITASHLVIKFQVPKVTSSCHNELVKGAKDQKVDYNENTKTVQWTVKSVPGGVELTLKTKISLTSNANSYNARKEIGPISTNFEIPMFNVSNMQIKYLRVEKQEKGKDQLKWIRYITQSSSYVCRT
eukprot:TRINITY_DN4128_c0_g1_i1.p1 TRINITY_DN4128_c0_g1~~TRINITY_DN4128_c0_g1_i1.p1  ORF type:complete len:447 (+),score=45.18 TRINITY_DN4128_c0_g1_i1:65-1405(+)